MYVRVCVRVCVHVGITCAGTRICTCLCANARVLHCCNANGFNYMAGQQKDHSHPCLPAWVPEAGFKTRFLGFIGAL